MHLAVFLATYLCPSSLPCPGKHSRTWVEMLDTWSPGLSSSKYKVHESTLRWDLGGDAIHLVTRSGPAQARGTRMQTLLGGTWVEMVFYSLCVCSLPAPFQLLCTGVVRPRLLLFQPSYMMRYYCCTTRHISIVLVLSKCAGLEIHYYSPYHRFRLARARFQAFLLGCSSLDFDRCYWCFFLAPVNCRLPSSKRSYLSHRR